MSTVWSDMWTINCSQNEHLIVRQSRSTPYYWGWSSTSNRESRNPDNGYLNPYYKVDDDPYHRKTLVASATSTTKDASHLHHHGLHRTCDRPHSGVHLLTFGIKHGGTLYSGQMIIFHEAKFSWFPFQFATFWGEVVWVRYNLTNCIVLYVCLRRPTSKTFGLHSME